MVRKGLESENQTFGGQSGPCFLGKSPVDDLAGTGAFPARSRS
jgi:hypothetical protein